MQMLPQLDVPVGPDRTEQKLEHQSFYIQRWS